MVPPGELEGGEGTAARFLSGWKFHATIATYEAKYYPLLMSQVCVLRAPAIADWAFGMCKRSFLDKRTSERVTIDGSDEPMGTLRALLPPALIAQLPAELLAKGK